MNSKVFFFFSFILLNACNSDTSSSHVITEKYQKISGATMGTRYNITYSGKFPQKIKKEIDDLLIQINEEVSTYDKTSFISKFNQASQSVALQDTRQNISEYQHFKANLYKAQEVYRITEGYFDPTVMPLVNYWGFGYTPKEKVTQSDAKKIEELRSLVGFNQIKTKLDQTNNSLNLEKSKADIQIDFSAIAKGYGVDAIAELLNKKGVHNYLVEIGGETRTKGVNPSGKLWTLAISQPDANAAPTDFYALIQVENKAMASSGNYRNFHEVNGVKYGHTLNPKTGYPEINQLRSATVIANDCITADAFATAFMTMGLEKSLALAIEQTDLEAYFIYVNENNDLDVSYTEGVKKYLLD